MVFCWLSEHLYRMVSNFLRQNDLLTDPLQTTGDKEKLAIGASCFRSILPHMQSDNSQEKYNTMRWDNSYVFSSNGQNSHGGINF